MRLSPAEISLVISTIAVYQVFPGAEAPDHPRHGGTSSWPSSCSAKGSVRYCQLAQSFDQLAPAPDVTDVTPRSVSKVFTEMG